MAEKSASAGCKMDERVVFTLGRLQQTNFMLFDKQELETIKFEIKRCAI